MSTIQDSDLDQMEQMTKFCNSFPCLRGRPGTNTWDQFKFAEWASRPISSGERMAAAFVLAVWSGSAKEEVWNQEPYSVGHFDSIEALAIWDPGNREAYIAWCKAPFWP